MNLGSRSRLRIVLAVALALGVVGVSYLFDYRSEAVGDTDDDFSFVRFSSENLAGEWWGRAGMDIVFMRLHDGCGSLTYGTASGRLIDLIELCDASLSGGLAFACEAKDFRYLALAVLEGDRTLRITNFVPANPWINCPVELRQSSPAAEPQVAEEFRRAAIHRERAGRKHRHESR